MQPGLSRTKVVIAKLPSHKVAKRRYEVRAGGLVTVCKDAVRFFVAFNVG